MLQPSRAMYSISYISWLQPAAEHGGCSQLILTSPLNTNTFFAGRPRKNPEKPPTRCRPFSDFARKHALNNREKYAPRWGKKRCVSGRVIKPRIDPRIEWPRVHDFQARFRLPPSIVEQLTDEFEQSPFRPGKGKHEKRGSPIPLFHKVKTCPTFM